MTDKPYTERTGGSYTRDPKTKELRLEKATQNPEPASGNAGGASDQGAAADKKGK